MFQKVGQGYVNKIAGFLTKAFVPKKIEASQDDEIDYAHQLLIEQATEYFNDEKIAKHVVAIFDDINNDGHAYSPQYVFSDYACRNEIPISQQKIISAYLRDRNLDVWSADDLYERDREILVLAQQIDSDFQHLGSIGAYSFYGAPGPYMVAENTRTNAAWIINATNLPDAGYMGQAYPSKTDAFEAIRNITKRETADDPNIREAMMPQIHIAGNTSIIEVNGKSFSINTLTDPPRFEELEQSPYDADPEIRQAMMTTAKIEGFDAGVTRIKVIHRGNVVMGTILGARTHHAPSGEIDEYRVSLDKPHSKIVWVRDSEVVTVYTNTNNNGSKKFRKASITRSSKSSYVVDGQPLSRIAAANYLASQYSLSKNEVAAILIDAPMVFAQQEGEFTAEDARKAGEEIGIDWGEVEFTPESLAKGMCEEAKEHDQGQDTAIDLDVISDRRIDSAKIASSHLLEDPQYYDKEEAKEEAESTGESDEDGFSVYAQLTSNPAPAPVGIPGTKPAGPPAPDKEVNGPSSADSRLPVLGSPATDKPSTTPKPNSKPTPEPELTPEPKIDDGGDDRMGALTTNINSLADQIGDTAKSMFKVDLDDKSRDAVIKQVINTLATEIAKSTADRVLESYSPADKSPKSPTPSNKPPTPSNKPPTPSGLQ